MAATLLQVEAVSKSTKVKSHNGENTTDASVVDDGVVKAEEVPAQYDVVGALRQRNKLDGVQYIFNNAAKGRIRCELAVLNIKVKRSVVTFRSLWQFSFSVITDTAAPVSTRARTGTPSMQMATTLEGYKRDLEKFESCAVLAPELWLLVFLGGRLRALQNW